MQGAHIRGTLRARCHSSTLWVLSLQQPVHPLPHLPGPKHPGTARLTNAPGPLQVPGDQGRGMACLCPQTHRLPTSSPKRASTPVCQPPGSFPLPLTLLTLTSSTWAWVCCSLLLLVRFGGGAGGPPSPAGAAGGAVAAVADLRGRGGLRPGASSHRPRGQGSAHPPVHPSTDGNPGFRPAPPPASCVTLSRAPSPLRASVSPPVK